MQKYVFITGADRGLGFELARKFLGDGYTVFAGRYMPEWPWLDDLKRLHGEMLQLVELDVSEDSSVGSASAFIRERTDRLDILVNNAALGGGSNNQRTIFDELDFDLMQRLFNVNTLGALRVTHSVIKLVMTSETRLIANISSEAGSIGACYRTGWYAYCMSKAALNMQSAILHNSIREQGGQVMVFHPGWMRTYMGGKLNTEAAFSPETSAIDIKRLIDRHEEFNGSGPAFIDHLGNRQPW
jgi:NAD(P)-dependent dehydrogenase (short-subunit alcohol dehydrogenase family)